MNSMSYQYRYLRLLALFCFTLTSYALQSQSISTLRAGFDPQECDDLLRLSFPFTDTVANKQFIDFQEGYHFLYRSPSVGMDNVWDLWLKGDSTVVITLRGTTADMKSLLADFYSAMVPAKGKIRLDNFREMDYKLAESDRAAVHVGFLIAFAFLADDMLPKIDSLYNRGFTDYLVAGHSQGGALSYYVSAWLRHLQKDKVYPEMRVKTYASASPKLGNMYFAYDYDNMSREGWSYSLINSQDAIPEMPFTTQQVDLDMNDPNPVLGMMESFDKMSLIKRVVLKRAFNKMIKEAANSAKTYQKYLGEYLRAFVKDMMPELEVPEVIKTSYYVRPGVQIALLANDNYFERYKNHENKYYHHGLNPYRVLLREYYPELGALSQEEADYLLEANF